MKTRKIHRCLIFLLIALVFLSTMTAFSGSNVSQYEGRLSLPKTITFIEKSTGLQTPALEGGNTELELADMNNDGNPDLISVGDHGNPYVNTDEHGIMVWFNNGDGTWSVYQVGDFGYGGIEAGDLDLDGNLSGLLLETGLV